MSVTWTDSDPAATADVVQYSYSPDFAAAVDSDVPDLLSYASPPGGKGIFGTLPSYTTPAAAARTSQVHTAACTPAGLLNMEERRPRFTPSLAYDAFR